MKHSLVCKTCGRVLDTTEGTILRLPAGSHIRPGETGVCNSHAVFTQTVMGTGVGSGTFVVSVDTTVETP